MATLKGGDQLMRRLQDMARARGKVRAGVLEGATNRETGEPIAPYAAMNEFGGVVNIPARTQTLYFRQNRDGTVDNRFVAKERSNFAQDVTIPAHSVTIPARPFIRNTIKREKDVWTQELAKMIANGRPVQDALKLVGIRMAEDIQATINSNMRPPNSPATIRAKTKKVDGGAPGETMTPGTLIDTGSMLDAVDYKVDA